MDAAFGRWEVLAIIMPYEETSSSDDSVLMLILIACGAFVTVAGLVITGVLCIKRQSSQKKVASSPGAVPRTPPSDRVALITQGEVRTARWGPCMATASKEGHDNELLDVGSLTLGVFHSGNMKFPCLSSVW